MVALRAISLYLLQFGDVALIDLAKALVLPVRGGLVACRKGIIDLKSH